MQQSRLIKRKNEQQGHVVLLETFCLGFVVTKIRFPQQQNAVFENI